MPNIKKPIKLAADGAITDAINTNNGVITAKIAEEIATVNQRITNEINTINSRLDDIESRLDALEDKVDDLMNRKLEITFEDTEDIAILAGGFCKVKKQAFDISNACFSNRSGGIRTRDLRLPKTAL